MNYKFDEGLCLTEQGLLQVGMIIIPSNIFCLIT